MKCAICGKTIVQSGSNWKIIEDSDGNKAFVHKKCPKPKSQLSDEERESFNNLKNKITTYATTCPMGIIKERPMNFKYAMQIVGQMKSRGFSYDDISYALDKVVELQNGFWGMGAVNNKIEVIIEQKRQHDVVVEQVKSNPKEEITFDLGKLMSGCDDEW